MKLTINILCILLVGWLSGCSAVNVQEKKGVDFSRYRTYDWAKTDVKATGDQNPIYKSSLAEQMIKDAINSEFGKLGIQQAQNNAQPDFYVTYHLYVEDAERTVSNPPAAGFAYPYAVSYRGGFLPVNYGYWYSPAYFNTGYRTEQYKEGTLILDIIDARSNDLVWRGSIADPVDNPAQFGKQFSESARDILEKFPAQKS